MQLAQGSRLREEVEFSIRDMGSPVTWTEGWVLAWVDGDVADRSGMDPDQTRAWG